MNSRYVIRLHAFLRVTICWIMQLTCSKFICLTLGNHNTYHKPQQHHVFRHAFSVFLLKLPVYMCSCAVILVFPMLSGEQTLLRKVCFKMISHVLIFLVTYQPVYWVIIVLLDMLVGLGLQILTVVVVVCNWKWFSQAILFSECQESQSNYS